MLGDLSDEEGAAVLAAGMYVGMYLIVQHQNPGWEPVAVRRCTDLHLTRIKEGVERFLDDTFGKKESDDVEDRTSGSA